MTWQLTRFGQVTRFAAWRSFTRTAFDFQDATKTNGKFLVPSFALNTVSAVFDEHFRRFGGVTVAELNDIVFAILNPTTPVRGVVAVFNPLRAFRNPIKRITFQNQV